MKKIKLRLPEHVKEVSFSIRNITEEDIRPKLSEMAADAFKKALSSNKSETASSNPAKD